jgi:hypothetical protein
MAKFAESARTSPENLVLTVRGDSPERKSLQSNTNSENVPEPVFYVNPSYDKLVTSELALVDEIESLKLQLKSAKTANLEAKIIIEGCNNDIKDKIMVVNEQSTLIDNLKKKIQEQTSALEEENRLISGRDEHLTRFYDQKMVAFKSQVAELEEKLKITQKKHNLEIAKWLEIEVEIKKKLDEALEDVKAKEKKALIYEDENQKLLAKMNELSRNVSVYFNV